MKKTLQFANLETMVKFSKALNGGFLMNTSNLTLTGQFNENDVFDATLGFKANLIPTTEKVYSYSGVPRIR